MDGQIPIEFKILLDYKFHFVCEEETFKYLLLICIYHFYNMTGFPKIPNHQREKKTSKFSSAVMESGNEINSKSKA